LEDKLQSKNSWIEEDLNSTAHFDIDSIYRITCSGTTTYISSYLTNTTLSFVYSGGAVYTTSNTNRKANTGFGTVTKMVKHKWDLHDLI